MWITTPAGEHASIACLEAQYTWTSSGLGVVYAQFTSSSISSIEPHTGPHEREDLKSYQSKDGLLRLIQEYRFLEKLGQLERDTITSMTSRRLRPLPFQYAGLDSVEHKIRKRQRR